MLQRLPDFEKWSVTYICLLSLQISQMWEILYKMCKELFPDHQEGMISTTYSVVLLHSYHYMISFCDVFT